MRRKAIKLLEDVRDAAALIQTYTEPVTEAEFRANIMLRDAVERRFEVIGKPSASYVPRHRISRPG